MPSPSERMKTGRPPSCLCGSCEKCRRRVAQPQVMQPGSTCDTCGRRVPHERKPSTPKTRTVSYRVPVDEYDAHRETVAAAARWVGVVDLPYFEFKVLALALALLLQDESARGFGQRQAA